MIQPLRTYHRWSFEALGVLLPIIFLAGLTVRPSETKPVIVAPLSDQHMLKTSRIWKKHAISTMFYSDGSAVFVEFAPVSPLEEPDLLLYWSPETTPSTEGIGENAKLLGAFEPSRRYRLPPGAKPGSLVLYSLAHRELVDTAVLDGRP